MNKEIIKELKYFIEEIKNKPIEINYTRLFEIDEYKGDPFTGKRVGHTGRQTIIIRINGGARKDEIKFLLKEDN